ncbi:HdeD family acid-resistance protein [Streptomyces sp. NPDC058691]|uniref:HdeD family acid-resistance protein n=1 Tax=Streptomyces sp. NPDC058691 TaxID=3346601 RepID=UPI00364F1F9F
MTMARFATTPLFWRALLAVVVGVVSLARPGVTVEAFVVVFSVYVLAATGVDAVRAFGSERVAPIAGCLLLGALFLAVAFGSLAGPVATAPLLAVWVAGWVSVTGILEVALSFRHDESAEGRAMWLLSGLVSILLGIVLAARPGAGAVTLACVFGVSSILQGALVLIGSARIRRFTPHARRIARS